MLTNVPDGARCFIDATIFYYHLVGTPPLSDDCSDFLKRIERGSVTGHTSAVAIAEATHKVMFAEIVHRRGVDHKGLIARIKRHPELLDGLAEHKAISATVRELNIKLEPIHIETLIRGAEPFCSASAADE